MRGLGRAAEVGKPAPQQQGELGDLNRLAQPVVAGPRNRFAVDVTPSANRSLLGAELVVESLQARGRVRLLAMKEPDPTTESFLVLARQWGA